MEKVDIAMVMVTYNALSDACFASIAKACAATPLKTACVIVDNASTVTDVAAEVRRHLPDALVHIRDRNYGFGHSNNFGARAVEASYYLFLNPDTILHESDVLTRLHAFMETHPDVGLVAPKLLFPDGTLQETCRRFPAWYMPFFQRTRLGQTKFGQKYLRSFLMHDTDHGVCQTVDWVQGSAMFVRAEAWRQIRGFDERFFMYFEDVDVCRRLHEAGFGVIYFPETSILHSHERESAKGFFVKSLLQKKVARFHVYSWIQYVWKWGWASVRPRKDRTDNRSRV